MKIERENGGKQRVCEDTPLHMLSNNMTLSVQHENVVH